MNCNRLVGATLALLCLTSCASMLDREVTYTAPHAETLPISAVDAYRVNTYWGLCSSLRSYLEAGAETGNLRFSVTYPGNLTVDLEKAKKELMGEPLGCYALEDIVFHVNRIIAYYEVTADFTYRVPPAEFQSIQTVRTADALDAVVKAVLSDFAPRFTVWVDIDGVSGSPIADSVQRVYDANPELALGYPELAVTAYPPDAAQGIMEVSLTYPDSTVTLRLRQRNMLRAAQTLAEEFADVTDDELRAAVMDRWQLDPEGGAGADAALLDGAATEEGLARAFALVERFHAELHSTQEGESQ